MKWIFTLTFAALLSACSGSGEGEITTSSVLSCKGVYTERVNGELKKFNQYEQGGRCLTDNMPLTQLEKTQEAWVKKNVTCTPQPGFQSRTLVSANNYYDYRDGKSYIQFDSSTGIFRRIILSEGRNGGLKYSKLQGCYYQRTGTGVDAHFGKQLLLDTQIDKVVTNQYFDPMEIFSYTEVGVNVNMVRFDDVKDYDYRNCPYLNTPWKFCEKIRDGNEMYFPVLPLSVQNDLKNEALLILTQFNWANSSKSDFDSLWDSVVQTREEAIREDYLYDVIHIVDTPRYIDQAWRDYMMGNRPVMPDVNSNTSLNVCYPGSKNVTYPDGSTGKVFGEVCYTDGAYHFGTN